MRNDLIDMPAKRGFGLLTLIAIVFGLILFLAGGPFRTVPAGHVGVKDFFGNVSASVLSPGINVVMPLTRVVKMSVQTQEIKVWSGRASRPPRSWPPAATRKSS